MNDFIEQGPALEDLDLNGVLQELEDYMSTAARVPLSGKIMVDGDYVLEMIDRIYAILPEEMNQAKQVLDQSDKLLESIQNQGKKILDEAKQKAAVLTQETEIVKMAQIESERIKKETSTYCENMVQQATEAANKVTADAKSYIDSILGQVSNNLNKVLASVNATRDNFSDTPSTTVNNMSSTID